MERLRGMDLGEYKVEGGTRMHLRTWEPWKGWWGQIEGGLYDASIGREVARQDGLRWVLSPCMGCKGEGQLECVQLKSEHTWNEEEARKTSRLWP